MSKKQTPPLPVTSCWSLDVSPGDPVEIFGRDYIFDRVDPDTAVTFRAPVNAGYGDFLVQGEDEHPRKPLINEVGMFMHDKKLIWREKPLKNEARAYARQMELDAEQARSMDKRAPFRVAIVRRYDAAPCSKSDLALEAFMVEAMKDPQIRDLEGAWHAAPSTVRNWLDERGTTGCRKACDGVSMRNRMKGLNKVGHPLEPLFYFATRAANVRGNYTMHYDRYVTDIKRINRGEPLNRNFLFDPDEHAGAMERPAEYPVPSKPYEAVSYQRFRRLARKLKSEKTHGRKTTAKGADQRYGGGGLNPQTTYLGELCWMDSTPLNKMFFVDDSGIPIGLVTMTLMQDDLSRVLVAGDLAIGGCTSSAVLRTVLKANQPKKVADELLEIDPDLHWLRLKPAIIGFDNAAEHHARSVEDCLAEAYIGTRFVGADAPRSKAQTERVIGTMLKLMIEHLPDSNYDLSLMRQHGFDPTKHEVICTVRFAREMLEIAMMIYNVSRHRGLDGLPPALKWKKEIQTRKPALLADVDKFERSIGVVDFATINNSGLEKFNRRYTPGHTAMKKIIEDFERAHRNRVGETAPKNPVRQDPKKRPSYKVKIKYDEGNAGVMRVYNQHAEPPEWVDFMCTDELLHDKPLWLHLRCLEVAKREGLEYITQEQQAVVRNIVFEGFANVDSQASERERRALAQAADDPRLREVLAGYVEVADEDPEPEYEMPADPTSPSLHGMADGRRKDAHLNVPRQKAAPAPVPATLKKKQGSGRSSRDPAAPSPRHANRTPPRDADRRDAGKKSDSKSTDKASSRRPQSKKLNWDNML